MNVNLNDVVQWWIAYRIQHGKDPSVTDLQRRFDPNPEAEAEEFGRALIRASVSG